MRRHWKESARANTDDERNQVLDLKGPLVAVVYLAVSASEFPCIAGSFASSRQSTRQTILSRHAVNQRVQQAMISPHKTLRCRTPLELSNYNRTNRKCVRHRTTRQTLDTFFVCSTASPREERKKPQPCGSSRPIMPVRPFTPAKRKEHKSVGRPHIQKTKNDFSQSTVWFVRLARVDGLISKICFQHR